MPEPIKPPPHDFLEDPQETIARARRLWRICLALPFLYLVLAWLIDRHFFKAGIGFWPMPAPVYRIVLSGFVCGAAIIQMLVLGLHLTFQRRIREVRLVLPRVAHLYWRRTLYIALCADIVSGLGLIAFLIHADWEALVGFCLFSYLLYIQAYPRARFLER